MWSHDSPVSLGITRFTWVDHIQGLIREIIEEKQALPPGARLGVHAYVEPIKFPQTFRVVYPMSDIKHPERFTRADAISDRLVDIWNTEIHNDVPPLEVFMGALLGMMALIKTMPDSKPVSVHLVVAAVQTCLRDLLDYFDRDKV